MHRFMFFPNSQFGVFLHKKFAHVKNNKKKTHKKQTKRMENEL